MVSGDKEKCASAIPLCVLSKESEAMDKRNHVDRVLGLGMGWFGMRVENEFGVKNKNTDMFENVNSNYG